MRKPKLRRMMSIIFSILISCGFISGLPMFAEASGINIIDYDMEGIQADTTQFFVLWVRGTNDYPITVNATVLEFVGSTGWPQLEIAIYEFDNWEYSEDAIEACHNFENYTCRCQFNAEGESIYTIAITNMDSVDDAVYNLSIHSPVDIDFQYTDMYDTDIELEKSNTVSVTYFGEANPYIFRQSGSSTRVVIYWTGMLEEEETYFFIYNKGETCELLIGLLGIPYYIDYPYVTGYIIDFEDYGDTDKATYLYTISNDSVYTTFTCEKDHRYSFWIDRESLTDIPDLYIVFDTMGSGILDYDIDLFAENPDDQISIRLSFEDPWLEFNRLNRDVIMIGLGVTAVGVGGLFTVFYLRRRYY
ncbi:MAG: conserved exported protein of unknown function [Candidatus Thorarchaeota archaeon]|nr:MAG: conserved exported protein of unknown function [Candidatus Thorarchaeota archaeon]